MFPLAKVFDERAFAHAQQNEIAGDLLHPLCVLRKSEELLGTELAFFMHSIRISKSSSWKLLLKVPQEAGRWKPKAEFANIEKAMILHHT